MLLSKCNVCGNKKLKLTKEKGWNCVLNELPMNYFEWFNSYHSSSYN